MVEQEGFRWRNDDGTETTATWRQLQDVDDSVYQGSNIRLRVLLNASGDPAPENYKLQYRKTSGGAWRDVAQS
jgi:hypothetical protein